MDRWTGQSWQVVGLMNRTELAGGWTDGQIDNRAGRWWDRWTDGQDRIGKWWDRWTGQSWQVVEQMDRTKLAGGGTDGQDRAGRWWDRWTGQSWQVVGLDGHQI